MRTVVLFLLYFLVVTPAGLLARIGRDPLSREWDREASTYWISSTGSRA
jgi:hypothetical protein